MMATKPQPPKTTNDPNLCRLVNAATIAEPFKKQITSAIKSSASSSRPPKLVGLLATASAPSLAYAEWTAKACEDVGVKYELRRIGAGLLAGRQGEDGTKGKEEEEEEDLDGGLGELEQAILDANEDEEVDGIMVYYPCYGGRQDQYLQQVVAPLKDVEGLNFSYLFSLYHNVRYISPQALAFTHFAAPAAFSSRGHQAGSKPKQPIDDSEKDPEVPSGLVKSILPCTPLAIVKTLEYVGVYNQILPYGSRARGKTITIINRSEVVGRPLAALLSNDGARVFSVDIDGVQEFNRRVASARERKEGGGENHPHHVVRRSKMTLEECLAISDVVVSGVPGDEYKVRTQDLKDGVICVNFSSGKNFDKASLMDKASIYVPAIGKLTITMLQRNLLRLRSYREMIYSPPVQP